MEMNQVELVFSMIWLTRRAASDKVLRGKVFIITKNPKYDGDQRAIALMVYKFFDKRSTSLADKSGKGGGVNNEIKQNKQLAEELHKPIIKNFLKRIVHVLFKDNIWGADLANVQLISKFNKGTRFLLCSIDIFSKYAWVVPLKDKMYNYC